ncbi:hypothetical protein F7725_021286 [Dissostichus mawsoni]|uniref:Uncharacterized protein n=1 Tax=Dissostichus mawsoni TaxID=36200 RepID=A0A7J5YIZ4_DISMA|nr:hypothetical protein F7725_021286 [Dissostichus mawsoni]
MQTGGILPSQGRQPEFSEQHIMSWRRTTARKQRAAVANIEQQGGFFPPFETRATIEGLCSSGAPQVLSIIFMLVTTSILIQHLFQTITQFLFFLFFSLVTGCTVSYILGCMRNFTDIFLDLLCFSLLLHLLDQEVQVDLSGEGNTLQGDLIQSDNMLERLFQKLIFSFWRSSMFFWRTLLSLFDLSLFQFNELNSLLQVVDAGCQSDATRHTASISRTPSVERNKSNNLSLTRTSLSIPSVCPYPGVSMMVREKGRVYLQDQRPRTRSRLTSDFLLDSSSRPLRSDTNCPHTSLPWRS